MNIVYKKVLRVICNMFFQIITINEHNLDFTTQYIYAMNHTNPMDHILITYITNTTVLVVALFVFRTPVIGSIFSLLDSIPVKKGNGTIDKICKVLNDTNNSLIIAPNGRFVNDDQFTLDSLSDGAFIAARKTNVKIIPVYHNLSNSFDVDNQFHMCKKTYVICGKPINPCGKNIGDIKQEYIDAMKKLMRTIDTVDDDN